MSDDTQDIEQLKQQNTERIQRLQQQDAKIDPVDVLKARLDLVTSVILLALGIDESVIEYPWELYVAELLNEVERELEENAD